MPDPRHPHAEARRLLDKGSERNYPPAPRSTDAERLRMTLAGIGYAILSLEATIIEAQVPTTHTGAPGAMTEVPLD